MATLKAHIFDFYGSIAPMMKMTISEAMANWPRELVIQWLNQGWTQAAEDCGGIQVMSKHNLTAGQETYSLSAATLSVTTVISLLQVVILKDAKVVMRLTPSYAPNLETPHGTVSSNTPTACSWKIQKHDAAEAIYELRLSPPASWTEAGGLWVICSVRPAEITDDDDSPDVLDTMGRMGEALACYRATRNSTFLQDYNDSKRLLGKSGLNNQPLAKHRWLRRGRTVDPRVGG